MNIEPKKNLKPHALSVAIRVALYGFEGAFQVYERYLQRGRARR